MDWSSVTFGHVLTIAVLGITALVAYFGWQRAVESKFSIFDNSVAARFAAMDKSFDTKFAALALQINTIMMRDIESFRARADAIEVDNRELHKRFHELSDDLNGVGLKLDRLERPRA